MILVCSEPEALGFHEQQCSIPNWEKITSLLSHQWLAERKGINFCIVVQKF